MGWWLTAADTGVPVDPTGGGSAQSITTALILTLGTVLVALITVGLPLLLKRGRTSESPPVPDARLGERVAVLVDHDITARRTLDQLDRHVDGIGDRVDQMRRDVDQILRHLGLP